MSSILSALAGHLEGGQSPAGPAGPSIQVSPQQRGGQGAVQALQQALSALHQFVEDADDDVDRQTALQCYAKLQSILATEQKEKESALGTTPAHKALAKATSRSGY